MSIRGTRRQPESLPATMRSWSHAARIAWIVVLSGGVTPPCKASPVYDFLHSGSDRVLASMTFENEAFAYGVESIAIIELLPDWFTTPTVDTLFDSGFSEPFGTLIPEAPTLVGAMVGSDFFDVGFSTGDVEPDEVLIGPDGPIIAPGSGLQSTEPPPFGRTTWLVDGVTGGPLELKFYNALGASDSFQYTAFFTGPEFPSLVQTIFGSWVLRGVPGDYDGDGSVGLSDYDVWSTSYGSSGPFADGNEDGVVDAADYTVWRDLFGAQSTAAVPAPEPSGIFIVAVAAFCGVVGRRSSPRCQPPTRASDMGASSQSGRIVGSARLIEWSPW